MLSVVIPSHKDPLVHNTVKSLLNASKGDMEIIPVLDGWDTKFPDDKRIRPVKQEQKGMREAINEGVRWAKGDYLMRTDSHCLFADGFDVALTENMEKNWIVNPRRYKLDPEKWQVMPDRFTDYEKLVIEPVHKKFHGINWKERTEERRDFLIDEDMAMQGSVWAMPHKWWDDTIKELSSEGYGTHYQDSIEMIFKTWQAGGKLMLNKKTWFAHKHRSFNRTHHYSNDLARRSWDYALEVWGDYYKDVVVPKWKI